MRSSQFCFPQNSIPIFASDFEFYFYFNSISFQEALSLSIQHGILHKFQRVQSQRKVKFQQQYLVNFLHSREKKLEYKICEFLQLGPRPSILKRAQFYCLSLPWALANVYYIQTVSVEVFFHWSGGWWLVQRIIYYCNNRVTAGVLSTVNMTGPTALTSCQHYWVCQLCGDGGSGSPVSQPVSLPIVLLTLQITG